MTPELIITLGITFATIVVIIGIYASIGHKYVINGENLMRYDIGGKHDHEPSAIVNISSIEKIKRIEKSGKLKRLKIYRKGDSEPIMSIKTRNLEKILNELAEINNQIKVTK